MSWFVDKIAVHIHDLLSDWMEHNLFSMCIYNMDGSITISKEIAGMWHRQIGTQFAQLPEDEKDNVRVMAMDYGIKIARSCRQR